MPQLLNLTISDCSKVCYNWAMSRQNKLPKRFIDYPEYWVFRNMQQRCDNPKHKNYKEYGGRGISYSERWKDFVNFIEDMGERPSSKFTLERVDNEKDYSPENCIWADWYTQSMNRRKRVTNTSGYTGVSWFEPTSKWRARISYRGKRRVIGYYDTIEEAARAYSIEKASFGLL